MLTVKFADKAKTDGTLAVREIMGTVEDLYSAVESITLNPFRESQTLFPEDPKVLGLLNRPYMLFDANGNFIVEVVDNKRRPDTLLLKVNFPRASRRHALGIFMALPNEATVEVHPEDACVAMHSLVYTVREIQQMLARSLGA